MKLDELLIEEDRTVLEAMRRLDETGHRILFVAPQGKLKAVVTDSDVRRYILRGGALTGPVREMANYHPKSVAVEERGRARKLLLQYSIDALPVLDRRGVINDVIFEATWTWTPTKGGPAGGHHGRGPGHPAVPVYQDPAQAPHPGGGAAHRRAHHQPVQKFRLL